MANRLKSVLLISALAGTFLVAACGDDDAISSGGQAGDPGASGQAGDPGAGGSGIAGSSVGGQGATGGQGQAGGGQAGEPSAGGVGGVGGEGPAAGGPSEGGAGGSPDAGLVYACGQSTINHTVCSAAASLGCTDPTECSDCVAEKVMARDDFKICDACLAQWDRSLQCGIDAFTAGDTAAGFECFEDYGADLNEACFALGDSAVSCLSHYEVNGCPETWPLDD